MYKRKKKKETGETIEWKGHIVLPSEYKLHNTETLDILCSSGKMEKIPVFKSPVLDVRIHFYLVE